MSAAPDQSEREFERLCIATAQLPDRMRYAFVLRMIYGYRCRKPASVTESARERRNAPD